MFMTIRQRFLEQLDNLSIEGVDISLGILLLIIILFVAFKFGKKDDGKTIFDGSNSHWETFDEKDDNEGFI